VRVPDALEDLVAGLEVLTDGDERPVRDAEPEPAQRIRDDQLPERHQLAGRFGHADAPRPVDGRERHARVACRVVTGRHRSTAASPTRR
jgi:hypothetical protein